MLALALLTASAATELANDRRLVYRFLAAERHLYCRKMLQFLAGDLNMNSFYQFRMFLVIWDDVAR